MSESLIPLVLNDPAATLVETKPSRSKTRQHKSNRQYESTNSILLTETRIEEIRKELKALLRIFKFESNGEPIDVDGFQLRNIADWADYPSSLSDIFWHLSSVCNYSCEFCYEKGNPPGFPIQNATRMATAKEIETRLRHYDPAKRKGIFTVRTAINEPFVNKHAMTFLKQMRLRSPNELISFVTNGSFLTEEVVQEIAQLQPVFFNVSMYSTDIEVRKNIIKDRKPDRAIRAVELLKKYKVPCMANLVMWPTITLEDMEKTVRFMAENGATVMRICLGGYSKYLKGDFPRFKPEEYWPIVVEEVERIRPNYAMPIIVEPNSYTCHDTETRIEGVVSGSPADKAGLLRGDKLLAINNEKVHARMELLSKLRNSTDKSTGHYRPPGVVGATQAFESQNSSFVNLSVQRGEQVFDVTLVRFDPDCMNTFPYGTIANYHDFMYGLVITDCLKYSSLLNARQIITRRSAQHTLLLSSVLIEPMVQYMLDRSKAFDGLNVDIRIAENIYFGGSINAGDLLVVEDFIAAIRAFISEERNPPDLVLIPESPFASSMWGRDLTGQPWTDIERIVGIPVELISCGNITF